MKKVLVTGGLGFIGSNLIKLLLKKNYYVINIDKVTYSSNKYNVKEYDNNKNYKFIKLDINSKKLTKIFKRYKPIGVFNLAAETHVDRSIDNPSNFIKSNILGTFNLLESFRKFCKSYSNTKLIHISTDEVFGDVLTGRSNENFKYKPSSPYAASKASSDHLVSSYVRTFKIPAIITNCSNNYGPCQHPEKLIPKLIYNIINNRELPIYGNGKNSREWIYVMDHCEGLLKVFLRGKKGEFYNIGSNKNLNNLQITKYLINIAKKHISLGKKVKIKFVKDRPGHDLRYALNSDKIKSKLKWNSKTKIFEGLNKTFLWYYNNQKYFKNLKKKDITKRLGT
ncbi:dTDP-glucose 4,6-dehydratase [Candidatus Pelagibacter sp.]|nr:dTDP-glucose 4,6-dehydratase [Candidatus Pelagibacter sp.]